MVSKSISNICKLFLSIGLLQSVLWLSSCAPTLYKFEPTKDQSVATLGVLGVQNPVVYENGMPNSFDHYYVDAVSPYRCDDPHQLPFEGKSTIIPANKLFTFIAYYRFGGGQEAYEFCSVMASSFIPKANKHYWINFKVDNGSNTCQLVLLSSRSKKITGEDLKPVHLIKRKFIRSLANLLIRVPSDGVCTDKLSTTS